jgi:PRA1 family protein 1
MRRRHMQDWELRDPRFEEIESEDDGYGQGVILDPNTYAARDARARGFVSDELYFDGYDLGQDRVSRRGLYDQARYEDDFDSDEMDLNRR